MELPPFFREIDVHTHTITPDHPAIVSITPRDSFGDNPWYSVGIHPWDAGTTTEQDIITMRKMIADPRCVAIGECGLDSKHNPETIERQEQLFRQQAQMAEQLRKPLIIHCVGAMDKLLRIKKEMQPNMPWIIHGFRGKSQQAKQLTAHGLYLSLGEKHNAQVPAAVDPHWLLHETD